jgi:ATP-dependent Clp protease ATP-binding subunit ClpC
MTSNVGVRDIKAGGVLGFTTAEEQDKYQQMKNTIEDSVKRLFNPEFLNRVDDMIVFRSLSKDDIFKIIDIQMRNLLKRLNAMNLSIQIDGDAKTFLAEKGYDEKYGARPLRRTIQRYIEDELAELMLRGEFSDGGNIQIGLDKEKQQLTFTKTDAPALEVPAPAPAELPAAELPVAEPEAKAEPEPIAESTEDSPEATAKGRKKTTK